MLILPIKKIWFDMISKGIKKEEYREETSYYRSRLEPFVGKEIECKLRNGYSSISPTLKVRARIERGIGNPDWGAEPGKVYYKLIILDKEYIEPEIFVIRARRCKRCGGILISSDAVKDGYGHTCKMKTREEERQREYERKTQYSLFDDELDDTEFSELEGIDGDFIDDI